MRWLYIVAAVLAVLVAGFYGWRLIGQRSGSLSPEALAQQALSAQGEAERQKAAVDLASAGPKGLPQLRRVLRESPDPAVRASCAQGLGDLRDYESVDLLIESLADKDPLVRARAEKALARLLRRDVRFPVDAPAADRARAQAAIRQTWKQLQAGPLLEHIKAGKRLAYYYDRNSGRLFEAPEEAEGLIEAPSGPYHGRPAGAAACVFAYGTDDDPSRRFVGYLMVPEPLARKHGEKIAGTPPRTEALVVVCRPGEDTWVYLGTPGGEAVTGDVVRRSGGRPVIPCHPGW